MRGMLKSGLAALAMAGLAGGCLPVLAAPVDVVPVTGGKLKGVATDVAGVQVFKGVPFAGPTGGAARFKPPQPVVPWDGIKVADTWGDQVLQDINLNPPGGFWGDEFYYDPAFMPKASENGLNLNVFTPAKDAADKLPVYVFIHGGGNDHGYASEMEFWAPKLAAKGIIVVPVQYRVGALGFLSLKELSDESGQGSGNYAMRDLVAALQWVKDNIAGFGGDPANVTIGGQSAGSRNVGMLLRTPMAKGLFRRAVMESASGGLLDTKYPSLADKEASNKAALQEIFGKAMSPADLRAIPAEDFLKPKVGTKILHYALHEKVGQHIVDGTVLTPTSVNLLRDGALDGVDILIGSNADERTSLDGKPESTMVDDAYSSFMQKTYGDGWKAAYRASDPMHAHRLMLRSKADNLLQVDLISAAYATAHNTNTRAFVYYFDNPPPGRNVEFYGSFHSAELWYFFSSLRDRADQRPWTDRDHRMADTMSSYLANFVRTGDPNGDGLPVWQQPTKGPAFMRFADGYAYPVKASPYPTRDALNRDAVLRQYGLQEVQLTR